MSTTFFVSWELWQKLSFFLAVAMLVSFAAGLMDLYFMTRASHLHARLDVEKRTYVASLRAAGLRPSGTEHDDFPFGVRALEMGFEVDGVWVVGRPVPRGEGESGGDGEEDPGPRGPTEAVEPYVLRHCRPARRLRRSDVVEGRRDTVHGMPDEFDEPIVNFGNVEIDKRADGQCDFQHPAPAGHGRASRRGS